MARGGVAAWVFLALLASLPAAGQEKRDSFDTALRRAEQFVARSERYLHQSKLRPGMTGHGLTVMSGTDVGKFNVTVVSVLRNYLGPQRDVILCRLSGLGLEQSGILEGMSGSPVFVSDPAGGKEKMIGAVAYSWRFQKEALTGVQPIVQMLAVEGLPLPGARETTQPRARASTGAGAAAGAAAGQLARAVLRPERVDFSRLALPGRFREGALPGSDGPRLVALGTPVMVAGAGTRTVSLAEEMFAGTNLVPVQTGSVSSAEARAAADARLEPGMAVAVPLVSGDADWAAVGTVTEVIGDRVLAFGHAFYGEGPVEMPMGPAYVHAVVPTIMSSFKLASTLKVTGALTQDEYSAIGGQIGKKARTVPMSMTIRWPGAERKFRYELLRHEWLTAVLASLLTADAVETAHDLPERHTLDYAVRIQFERLGEYAAANRSSGNSSQDVRSDVTRPLAALMNTSLGEPAFPLRIDVTVTVRTEETTAAILDLKLDRNVYRPGQTLTGRVTIRPFRSERQALEVSLALPEDLPDGTYTLVACDAASGVEALEAEMPHRFDPRTVEELFEAIGQVVGPRTDRLYLRLPLPEAGLAVDRQELVHPPPSLAGLLARAAPMDTKPYRRAAVVERASPYVLHGSARAAFTVEKHPARSH